MRAEGRPLAPTVETVIAVGSGTCAAMASAIQAANCCIGSWSTRLSSSGSRAYSLRSAARSSGALASGVFILRDFDQVAVGIAEIDRLHRAERAGLLDGAFGDLHAAALHMRHHVVERALR